MTQSDGAYDQLVFQSPLTFRECNAPLLKHELKWDKWDIKQHLF